MDLEFQTRDIENPLANAGSGEDFPVLSGYDDEDDLDTIGRNSLADMTDSLPHQRRGAGKNAPRKTLLDKFHTGRKKVVQALEYRDLKWYTKIFLVMLILPTAVVCLLKQLRMFVVLGVFNYSGINLRPFLVFDITPEREMMRYEEKFNGGPFTLSKMFYVSQRYMTYWVVVVLLIVATPFVNEINILDVMNNYRVFKHNPTLNYMLQVAVSILIGFANIVPSKPVRADISSFLSSFTEEDYTIRDCCHTRLKSLTEVLDDIKAYGFVLLHTDIGSPIIVSTLAPEELRKETGFTALLSTDNFDNNQVLRFIQIEEDVDSFFVLRNDVGMCHRVDFDPFCWQTLYTDLKEFKIRLEISEFELNIYGGASLVLLVGMIAATSHLPVSRILGAWLIWPIIWAVVYKRRRSKLASVNFFTLDGRDRKYQPFNNMCVSSDDIIMTKIYEFKFFKALFKFTLQGRYLVHTLLKVTESVNYEWMKTGLKMRDFKRLASLAATIYERDVGIITPNAKAFYPAPRKQNEMCVVCIMNANGEVTSLQMTRGQFEKAAHSLKEGSDSPSMENTFFK